MGVVGMGSCLLCGVSMDFNKGEELVPACLGKYVLQKTLLSGKIKCKMNSIRCSHVPNVVCKSSSTSFCLWEYLWVGKAPLFWCFVGHDCVYEPCQRLQPLCSQVNHLLTSGRVATIV